MADQMKATPRSPILGLFSDIVNLPLQYMSAPERTQQMQGVAQFLYGTGIPKTLERASYGDSLFSGSGMTLRPKEETINAAMNVAPFAPAVGRLASRAVKATEGMPVGMGIKSVGDDIFNLSKQEFLGKPRITKNANAADLKPIELTTLKDVEPQPFMGGKYQIKMNEDGAVVLDKGKPIASYNFGDTLVVDKPYRKSGLAQELVYEWRTSFPAPAVAKERTKASQAIQEKVWERIQNEKRSLPEQSPYPQQAALPTGATGLPSPQSLTMPSVPTVEQMQKYGRTETVPLSKAVSFQSARDWEKFNAGKYNGDLVAGYGDKPLALRLETGEYVIYDGNHRTDLALQKGLTELPMNVIDVKSYDPTHAGRRPVPPSMSDDELLNSLLGNEVKAPQQVPQEIPPTFTDPFGNTIGSSIR
jgi:hypothetical protein